MNTQQTFNTRSITGCVEALKRSIHSYGLDDNHTIQSISFEFPDSLEGQVITSSTVLDLVESKVLNRNHKELKAIVKNFQHAINFKVLYPNMDGWQAVSWCWDFNVMVIDYFEKELERRFQEFMKDKKPKQETQPEKVETSSNWSQYVSNMVETLPTVSSTVKGRLPEYLKSLFILSSMSYRTEDKTTLYRIAICNKSPNVSTAYDSFYLVLDTKNNYRGFADSELRACELAELVIKKPLPDFILTR